MTLENHNDITPNPKHEKPISYMGILKDETFRRKIAMLGADLKIPPERIEAVIQRESGGNPRARSGTGSRGIMQLTSSVFDDMATIRGPDGKLLGRGMKEYIDKFRALSNKTLSILEPPEKYGELRTILKALSSIKDRDISQYRILITKLRILTEVSTRLGDPYPNLIIGSIYLASIDNRSQKIVKSAQEGSPQAISKIAQIMKQAKGASISVINNMLTAKAFHKISPDELQNFITHIFQNPDSTTSFLTLYDYNGDKKQDSNGTEHRIHYALATLISEAQIRKLNKKNNANIFAGPA